MFTVSWLLVVERINSQISINTGSLVIDRTWDPILLSTMPGEGMEIELKCHCPYSPQHFQTQ